MQIYETEEEQLEAIKKWWEENGRSVIIGIVLGFGALAGWNIWQENKKTTLLKASGLYQQLLTANTDNQNETLLQLGDQLGNEYSGTPYANFSQLFLAKQKMASNDLAGAKEILQQLLTNSDDSEFNYIVRFRLVRVMAALQETEAALAILAQAPYSKAFESQASELKGDLLLTLGRTDEAREAYQNASDKGAKSPLLDMKLGDLALPAAEPESLESLPDEIPVE